MIKKTFAVLFLTTFSLVLSAGTITLKITSPAKTYQITPEKSGNYGIVSSAKTRIKKWQQHFAKIRIDQGPLLKRRLLGYNRTKANEQLERLSLQAGKRYSFYFEYDPSITEVDTVKFVPVKTRKVPRKARNYKPKYLPPAGHPKLFVNAPYLAALKKQLDMGDNKPVWTQVKKNALAPFVFTPSPDKEVPYMADLLDAVKAKAFYYLVTGSKKQGRQAVDLISAYAQRATLGNGQDICRKVGEIIFASALVYDWCFPLLSEDEKLLLRKRMLFYAEELETSWPPFRQYASAGHGNESQFNRDLLAMALAVYDEDPLPYTYVAYQLFEYWLPLKRYTYKSGRHSQGTSYGQFRAQFDLLAAVQFKRTFGIDVLPEEIKDLPYYWYYQRLPDGTFLIEGDDNWKVSLPQYVPLSVSLLSYMTALYPNAEFKMERIRSYNKRRRVDPVLFLLTNDPTVKPRDLRASLPLTRLYKDPLPGLALRTGWNFTPDSDDLVLTMNGANYFLKNHQHGDQGSFQIYYRGYLVTDLGQYRYYGVPYDRVLNKTAAVHSMMRFYDPDHKNPKGPRGPNYWLNTGSQHMADYRDRPPFTLKELLTCKHFFCGTTPRAGFGPSQQKPLYNFLETDIAPSYPGRAKSYTRSFVFWNQNDKNRPGTLLILDRFQRAKPAVDPIFQLTTMPRPVWKNNRLTVKTTQGNKTGCVTMIPLIPAVPHVKIMTDKEARTFYGVNIPARMPDRREAKGSRTELRTKGDIFLNALQIHDGTLSPCPVRATTSKERIFVHLSDKKNYYLTSFGLVNKVSATPLTVNVPRSSTHLLLLDLAPGEWCARKGKEKKTFTVTENKGAIYGLFSAGSWRFESVKK